MAESKPDTSAAEAYDAVLVPAVFGPWAEVLIREAEIQAGMRVLDVACGTGVVARCAARACGTSGRTSGIDIDPAMIEVARAASLREGLSIDYHCAPVNALPFESGAFDAALCQHGLQYFLDIQQALVELRRVLRPNGRMVAATWTDMRENKGHWAMISALERRGIDATDMRKPFALSDPADLQTLGEVAGFAHVAVRTARLNVSFASARAFVEAVAKAAPSSRKALAKVPAPDWPAFLADVEAQLPRGSARAALEFPMASHFLDARR